MAEDAPDLDSTLAAAPGPAAEPAHGPTALERWLPWAAVAAAAVTAAWAIAGLLGQSLWWDEIYTAHLYAPYGPAKIFDPDAFIANNHVLFSLLTWAAVELAGPSDLAVRLGGLVPTLAAGGLVVGWAWRRFGRVEGAALAVLLATSPLYIDVATLGRGWGLAMLSGAGMLVASVALLDRADGTPPARRLLGPLVGLGAAALTGLLTILAMVVPFAAHTVPLLARRRTRWPVVATGAVAGVVSLAFYRGLLRPILDRTTSVGTNEGTTVGPLSFVTDVWHRLLADQFGIGSDGAAGAAFAVVVAGLVVAGMAAAWRRGDRAVPTVVASAIVGTTTVFWLLGAHLVDRYLSFLLPHALLLVALGVGAVAGWLRTPSATPEQSEGRGGLAGLAVAGVWLAVAGGLVWSFVDLQRTLAATPYEAVRDAADLVRAEEADVVLSNRVVGQVVFAYYLEGPVGGDDPVDVEVVAPEDLGDRLCSLPADAAIALLDYPYPDEADSGDLTCLLARGASPTRFEQRRTDRGITVWVVHGDESDHDH